MTWTFFEHVTSPHKQPCPDCHAKAGENCVIPGFPASMVHARRCFTPESNASIQRHYLDERRRVSEPSSKPAKGEEPT